MSDYPDPETEKQVILAAAPTLPGEIVDKMLLVAEEVRRLFMGSHEGEPELTVTLSTRTLVRWATLSLTFKGRAECLRVRLERKP